MQFAEPAWIRPHVRSWFWSFAGQAVQVVAQAGAFLLVAKCLPVSDLGMFIGIVAITATLGPFVGMGSPNLLIKHVSRDASSFPDRWASLVSTTLWSGSLLCLLAVPACRFLLPHTVPTYAIALTVVADMLFWRWPQLIGLTLQGLSKIHRKSQLDIFVSCARFSAALVLFALPGSRRHVLSWLLIYFVTALVVSGASLCWAISKFGSPRLLRLPKLEELKEAIWFVLSPSTQTINNDADKFMLAKLAGLGAAGIYGAGYRVLSAAFLPVQALLTVTYPQFFYRGSQGVKHTARYAARWLPIALTYSLGISVILFVAAPAITAILGPGYHETGSVIRSLAVLPVLKTLQFFFADALTGADLQILRVKLQGSVALFNILVNAVLIPRYGWQGAVVATLMSDGLLTFAFVLTVLFLSKRAQVIGESLDDTMQSS
jgi:O-antigen/teichoic acid export membrane protein